MTPHDDTRQAPTQQGEPIAISEHELTVMTAHLEEAHQATLPVMHEAVTDWDERLRSENDPDELAEMRARFGRPSRRGFLIGAGATLGGLVLAACSSSDSKKSSASSTTNTKAAASGGLATDLKIASLAAALENTAVATYQAGIDAANAGRLGTVPPAIVTFATTVQQQHKDHAAAWNAIITGAGKPAVTGVDTTVNNGVVQPAFAQVTDVAGLAKLALTLEDAAGATYLSVIPVVSDPGGVKTVATIQPVEMQHAAILNFVLGQYPVPDAFAKTDGARTLTDKIG
jgi:Ferritin-like domain